jgi:Cd27 binding protein (Siva)
VTNTCHDTLHSALAIRTKRRLPFGSSPLAKKSCHARHLPSSPPHAVPISSSPSPSPSNVGASSPPYTPQASTQGPSNGFSFASSGRRAPTTPGASDVPQTPTGGPPPPCYFCRRLPASVDCDTCQLAVCEMCTRVCQGCAAASCRVCTVTDYTLSREVEVCLDCHSAGSAVCGDSLGAVVGGYTHGMTDGVDVLAYQKSARVLFGL